jgi:predicted transcriptional regulator of viral defense system
MFKTAQYGLTQGERLLRKLGSQGKFIFRMEDAHAEARGIGIKNLRVLLSQLVRGGWLQHLSRGLYAFGARTPASPQIPSFAIATALVKPSAISHWSAMQYHGLTEHVPRNVTAFTTRKVITPGMRGKRASRADSNRYWEIAGVRYEYIFVTQAAFFGIEEIWIGEFFKLPITDRERTLLEGFISPRYFGGLGEILGILESHLGAMNLDKLIRYALQYKKVAVIKRLGWALESAGVSENTLAPLLNFPLATYRVLDPVRPLSGRHNKRWMIDENFVAESAS